MGMFNKQNKKYLFCNSSEHFLLNVNKISSKVILLMNEYNEIQSILKEFRKNLK